MLDLSASDILLSDGRSVEDSTYQAPPGYTLDQYGVIQLLQPTDPKTLTHYGVYVMVGTPGTMPYDDVGCFVTYEPLNADNAILKADYRSNYTQWVNYKNAGVWTGWRLTGGEVSLFEGNLGIGSIITLAMPSECFKHYIVYDSAVGFAHGVKSGIRMFASNDIITSNDNKIIHHLAIRLDMQGNKATIMTAGYSYVGESGASHTVTIKKIIGLP